MTGRNIKRIKAGEMDPPEEVNNDFEEDAGGSGHMTEVPGELVSRHQTLIAIIELSQRFMGSCTKKT